jgi:hypothetical protein
MIFRQKSFPFYSQKMKSGRNLSLLTSISSICHCERSEATPALASGASVSSNHSGIASATSALAMTLWFGAGRSTSAAGMIREDLAPVQVVFSLKTRRNCVLRNPNHMSTSSNCIATPLTRMATSSTRMSSPSTCMATFSTHMATPSTRMPTSTNPSTCARANACACALQSNNEVKLMETRSYYD